MSFGQPSPNPSLNKGGGSQQRKMPLLKIKIFLIYLSTLETAQLKKIILISGLFLLFAAASFAQTKMVTAEGVASIGSDKAAAHDKAIEDALRRAVEQAVGTMVESETSV